MNKVFKVSLILLLLFGAISCTQDIKVIKNDSLVFNFRAANGLEGSELTVSVKEKGKNPIVKKKQVSKSEEIVTFDFGEFKVGSNVDITATIVKDNLELYKAFMPITIRHKDNIVQLSLVRSNVKLLVKALLLLEDDLKWDSELNGAICEIKVGQAIKTYELKEGDTQILIDFGYYRTEEAVSEISAVIKDSKGIVLYASGVKKDYKLIAEDETEEIVLNLIKQHPIEVTVSSTVPLIKGLDSPSLFVVTASGVEKSSNEVGFVGEPYGVLKSKPFKVMVGEKLIASVISSQQGPQGEDIILFEEQYTVKENDSIIELKIPQVRTLLTISPKLENSNNNYRGSKFEVTIGDKVYIENFGELPASPEVDTAPPPLLDVGEVVVNLGGVELNKPLKISAVIKDQDDIFYSYEGEYTPTGNENDGRYELSNMVRNDGYFMWKNGGPNLCTVNYDLQMMNGCSQDLPKFDTIIRDFSFRDNGDVWILEDDMNLGLIKHGRYGTRGKDIPEFHLGFRSATNDNGGQVASNIAQVSSLVSYKDGVIVSSRETSSVAAGSNRLSFLTLKPSTDSEPNNSKLFVNDYTGVNGVTGDFVTAMAMGGDTIYIATLFNKKEIDPNTNFKIFKGTINQQNWTISNVTEILDGKTYSSNGKAIFNGFDFVVTDMQVVDGALYVLIFDNTIGPSNSTNYSNNHSRGALLKITDSGSSSIIGFHENKINSGEILNNRTIEDANRIYMLDNTKTQLLSNSFIGPRKIIAVKPKKIVIADAGAVKLTENPSEEEKELRKRIVTVNLGENLSIENVQDVASDLFEGSIGSCYSYSSGLKY